MACRIFLWLIFPEIQCQKLGHRNSGMESDGILDVPTIPQSQGKFGFDGECGGMARSGPPLASTFQTQGPGPQNHEENNDIAMPDERMDADPTP